VLDSGDVITEGVAITQYLADTNPEKNLAPAAPSIERAKLVGVLNYIAAEYHKSFSPLFNPMANDEVKAFAIANVKIRLDYLDNEFADGREFIMGESFTIADAYLFTVSNWVNHVGLKLVDWKNLAAYVKRISQRPSVQAALKAEGLI
jgi:glutathione S-transferase